MSKARWLAGVIAVVSAASGLCAQKPDSFPAHGKLATAEMRTLMFADVAHEYVIQGVKTAGKHPVVVLLHGASGNGPRLWGQTSLPTLGAANGFIVVMPTSTEKGHWNDGRGTTLGGTASTADDVGYLKALIAEVVAKDQGDPDAVFMAGISNGGFMTLHFACAAGELLRAGGDVAGALPLNQMESCKKKALPWITIHGDADSTVPFTGMADGLVINGRKQAGFLGSDATFTYFADKAGCAKNVTTVLLPHVGENDGSSIEKRVRTGCAGGTTSTQYVVHGGGHGWVWVAPNPKFQAVAHNSADVDPGTILWAHFAQTLKAAKK